VRVQAAGVNPVDAYIRTGNYGRDRALPYTPGSDGAGIVEAVGPEVVRVRPGDRVYTAGSLSGTYAERALCEENQVWPLPGNLSFAQGAGIWVPYGTAWRALLHRAQGRPGETVLVHGATGGVGTAAVQIARAHGFTVIATGGTSKGRAMVHDQGADHVLDHGDPDYLDQIKEATNGRGVDIILEMLANINLDNDLGLLARFGRVIVIGNRGRIEINPRDTMAVTPTSGA
jgi:NADPH2:quinone reductase